MSKIWCVSPFRSTGPVAQSCGVWAALGGAERSDHVAWTETQRVQCCAQTMSVKSAVQRENVR